jgi:hypothetical protein
MRRLYTPPPLSPGCAWGRVRRGLDRRGRLRSQGVLELRIEAIKDWA